MVTQTSGYETSASKSARFPNARRPNQIRIPSARINQPPAHREQRLSLLIMSVGGLLGHEDWFRQAREKGCRIYIPSGAIAGLDGIKSASIGRIESVLLISRKPVAAVRGSKYVVERNLPLDSLTEDTVIFEGLAEEATRALPARSNVAASLCLAIDPATRVPVCVRIMAVPGGKENVHEIRAQGEVGRLTVNVENVPSSGNPRTSQPRFSPSPR